jgi:glycosyltransferase involved in cell wall biosynthesis
VVEPENASLLADALRGLAGDIDKRRRMGDEARRIAVETLDRDAVLTRLLEELKR